MARDRLRIKINDNLEIAARDVRNIEIRTTVFENKDGKKVPRTKVSYASTLKGAIKICENEIPLFSEAKNLEQLKAEFETFTTRIEEIVEQYKLPNAKEFLGEAEENPKGLYGEDRRTQEEPTADEETDEWSEVDMVDVIKDREEQEADDDWEDSAEDDDWNDDLYADTWPGTDFDDDWD